MRQWSGLKQVTEVHDLLFSYKFYIILKTLGTFRIAGIDSVKSDLFIRQQEYQTTGIIKLGNSKWKLKKWISFEGCIQTVPKILYQIFEMYFQRLNSGWQRMWSLDKKLKKMY